MNVPEAEEDNRRDADRREALERSFRLSRTRNAFAVLPSSDDEREGRSDRDEEEEEGNHHDDEPIVMPHDTHPSRNAARRRRKKKSSPHKAKGKASPQQPRQEQPEGHEKGMADLDDFLLVALFGWLDGKQLSLARQVCSRWCAVIDAEDRLWKDLMRRELGWRPSERKHGKGAKRMQRRTLDFRLLYANMRMKGKSEKRKAEHKEEERKRFQAKLCAFVRKITPYVVEMKLAEFRKKGGDYSRFIDELKKQAPRWRACEHHEVKTYYNGTSIVCFDCELLMTVKTWERNEYWQRNWPKLLDYRMEKKDTCRTMALHFLDISELAKDCLLTRNDPDDCGVGEPPSFL